MNLFKSMIHWLVPVTSILMASLATTGAATSNEGASAPVATNTNAEFYLLIGQSNMAGRGKFEEGDAFHKDRVFILND